MKGLHFPWSILLQGGVALLLLGLPLACGLAAGQEETWCRLLAFPPRTEQWSVDMSTLWNATCPFSWWVFAPSMLFVVAGCLPFAVRSLRASFSGRRGSAWHGFPWWGWAGLVLFLGWLPVVWVRPEFAERLQVHSFAIMGLGHALLMDALAFGRSGTSLLSESRRRFLALFPASALLWWYFEYLNRFARNWYYVNLEGFDAVEYVVCFSLGCATILPSAVTTARWLGTFRCFSDGVCRGMWRLDVASGACRIGCALVAMLGGAGIVFSPAFAFPFVWLSPICALVLSRGISGSRTGLESLACGDWTRVWRYAVAMLLCGFVWETWGFWIQIHWIYSVPWLHRFAYAEMPAIGFAGYMPFGIVALLICARTEGWCTGESSVQCTGPGNGS